MHIAKKKCVAGESEALCYQHPLMRVLLKASIHFQRCLKEPLRPLVVLSFKLCASH